MRKALLLLSLVLAVVRFPALAQQPVARRAALAPGERVLFQDDLASAPLGEFPKRLEYLGGNIEVVEWKGARWLRATSKAAFAIALPELLPSRFRIEFKVSFPWWGMLVYGGPDGFVNSTELIRGNKGHSIAFIGGGEMGVLSAGGAPASVSDPCTVLQVDCETIAGVVLPVRIEVDGRSMKVEVGGRRMGDAPNANFYRTRKLYFETTGFSDNEGRSVATYIGPITVTAGEGIYETLVSSGRAVTLGITFDVDVGRIRPESVSTLAEIGQMLTAHPELRIRIEVHTDSVGDPGRNQALSEQRAAAVKAYLVERFGVEAARLETRGVGTAGPVVPADTGPSRPYARVELVKL